MSPDSLCFIRIWPCFFRERGLTGRFLKPDRLSLRGIDLQHRTRAGLITFQTAARCRLFPRKNQLQPRPGLALDLDPLHLAVLNRRAHEKRADRAKGTKFRSLVTWPIGEESERSVVALQQALVDDNGQCEVLEPDTHRRHEGEIAVVAVATVGLQALVGA